MAQEPDVQAGAAEPEPEPQGQAPEEDVPVSEVKEETRKKKKKSKSKSKSSKTPKATGFEENFADAPVTPAEYQEEQTLYDPSKIFADRIQIAIQRFVARRKLDSERKELFDKYLAFGGIDAGPKAFGGLDQADLRDMDAEAIAEARARHFVSPWVHEHAVVDFDGMLKAFLSSRLPKVLPIDSAEGVRRHVAVIRNFLNYLLHHDVCPEYADQIEAARHTCDRGEAQLWLLTASARALPGDFNRACSATWGGQFFDTYLNDAQYERAAKMGLGRGLSPEAAHKIVMAGLAVPEYFPDEMVALYTAQNDAKQTKVVRQFEADMEVTDLVFASGAVRQHYRTPVIRGIAPLGRLRARAWVNPACAEPDLTEEEEAELARRPGGPEVQRFEFFVEDRVLEHMFVGMKLRAQVYELSFGLWYFDTVTGALCSFFEFVPNEDMLGWREHRELPYRKEADGDAAVDADAGTGQEGVGDEEAEAEAEGSDVEHPALRGYEKGEDINIQLDD